MIDMTDDLQAVDDRFRERIATATTRHNEAIARAREAGSVLGETILGDQVARDLAIARIEQRDFSIDRIEP